MILKDIIKFVFVAFILFYIPGHALTKIYKRKCSPWERIILSISSGLFIVPQIYYYLENLRLHNLFLNLIIIGSIIYFIYSIRKLFSTRRNIVRFNIGKSSMRKGFYIFGMILLILIITLLVLSTSGVVYPNGMRFYQANAYDSPVHMAMIDELSKSPPHEFPFYSGLPLRGYYVGAFYWRALIQKISGLNSVDLFFRYCPLILFPLIIMMVFASINKITGSKPVSLLATFLIFLMSNLSWVFPIVDRLLPFKNIDTVDFSGSLLRWIMFNPPFAHGVLIFFMGCYFLKHSYEERSSKTSWISILFAGMLLGSLFEYKAFIWATVFPALFLVGIKEYFLGRETHLLKITMIAGIFSVISFFRILSSGTLSLFRFSLGHYPLSLLFLIGVLGIKIIGFQKIYQILKKWKTAEPLYLFLIIAMVFSFIFTHILLLESCYATATYNFFAIFLLGISLFAAESLISFTKRTRFLLKGVVFLIILVIGIGSTAFSFLAYFPEYSKYKVVSKDSLAAMNYIKKNSEESAVVLHNADTRFWFSTKSHKKLQGHREGRDSFVSALTARRAVLDCSWHMAIGIGAFAPGLNIRKNEIKLFFSTKDKERAKNILNKYNVSYVLTDQGEDLKFQAVGILKKVFGNNEASVYKVVQKEGTI